MSYVTQNLQNRCITLRFVVRYHGNGDYLICQNGAEIDRKNCQTCQIVLLFSRHCIVFNATVVLILNKLRSFVKMMHGLNHYLIQVVSHVGPKNGEIWHNCKKCKIIHIKQLF